MQPTRKPSALRIVVLGIGVVLLLWAIRLWGLDRSSDAALVAAIYGVILVVALLFERQYYNPKVNLDARGWEATDEKFIDPVTGDPVQVWFNAKTGERDYRPLK
jgi:hypothetical protein